MDGANRDVLQRAAFEHERARAGRERPCSCVTIPINAAHRAGALVIADLLLDPKLQAQKADPAVLGAPSVLPATALPAGTPPRASVYLLLDFGTPVAELPAARVTVLERRWKREVLR